MSSSEHVHHSHTKKYIIVFAGLAILTALELVAAEIETSYFLKASSLTLLAIAKAAAVAYWFMHLEEESFWLKFIACVPLAAVGYTTVVVLESLYR